MSFAHRRSEQMRPPPDHRNANRRARWHPPTRVTAKRGNNSDKTFIRKKSLSICTYNTRTINDLNKENKDLMIRNWSTQTGTSLVYQRQKLKQQKTSDTPQATGSTHPAMALEGQMELAS